MEGKLLAAVPAFGLLCILSRQDLSQQEIDGRLLVLPAVLGMILQGIAPRPGTDLLAALLPGMLLTLGSALTRGAIGNGDGLLFWSLGYLFPAPVILSLLTGSMLLAGARGLLLLLRLRRDGREPGDLRKTRFALIPVITLAYALEMMLWFLEE